MIETQAAEYLILQADIPGRRSGCVPIGVLLFDPGLGGDPGTSRVGIRLRRDWESIVPGEEDREVFELLAESLDREASELPAPVFLARLEDTLSNTIRISDRRPVLMANFDSTLTRLYRREIPAEVIPFRTHLPLYAAQAAAGGWSQDQGDPSASDAAWVEAPESIRLTRDMFAARVVGRSMEPLISDGAICAFRSTVAGSRENRLLLVENRDSFEHRYTVKRYRSFKQTNDATGEWRHARIRLEPLNPDFSPWDLDEDSELRVLGEFVDVLDPEPES
ncbi:MAG: S24 family peptidase [Bryobacteraceae bacterium]